MSQDTLKALREKRGKIVKEMRDLIDQAEAEKRDLLPEENKKHDDLFAAQEKIKVSIEREERTNEAERDAATAAAEAAERAKKAGTKKPGPDDKPVDVHMRAFRKFLAGTPMSMLAAEEVRALQAGSDTEGGFLVAPQQFVASLLMGVDDATFIRAKATKFSVATADSLGVPTLDTDLDDAEWTTELQTGSEDTAMRFGKRELRPHPVAKRIKISKQLLRVSILPIEQHIRDRMAYKFGVTAEKAYMTGNGNLRPLGLFVASADGVPTSRDVSAGNTTTTIGADNLIETKYSLKGQYWPRAEWLFHRDAMKQIAKLKDGEGQYLWRVSLRDGEPDTILNRPLNMSEYVPNTFTTGLYVGMFGDLSKYWIADALDLQVQRLIELYAETNQDGFIGRMESDGMPVLAEAFARVKLA